jgi:hypothetical protein
VGALLLDLCEMEETNRKTDTVAEVIQWITFTTVSFGCRNVS